MSETRETWYICGLEANISQVKNTQKIKGLAELTGKSE